MAEIVVQLKNDNGDSIFPVTTGEAIRYKDDRTVDKVIEDLEASIATGVQSVGAQASQIAQNAVANKAGYLPANDYSTNFPVGSMLLCSWYVNNMVSNHVPLNSEFDVYVYDSYPEETEICVKNYPQSLKHYSSDGGAQKYKKISGTWYSRGCVLTSSTVWTVLMQKVA